MKFVFLLLIAVLFCCKSFAQKPKNGTYTYTIAFEEWQGKSLGATCTVMIKDDSIKIINNGSLSGKKGDIIDEGIIMKHAKTGKWIIAHNPKDIDAKELCGCCDGPAVIDFKRKIFHTC